VTKPKTPARISLGASSGAFSGLYTGVGFWGRGRLCTDSLAPAPFRICTELLTSAVWRALYSRMSQRGGFSEIAVERDVA